MNKLRDLLNQNNPIQKKESAMEIERGKSKEPKQIKEPQFRIKEPKISPDEKLEVLRSLQTGKSNVKTRVRREDYSNFELVDVSYPEKITPSGRCKKRFQVQVKFKDETGKLRKKLVRFGKEGKKEFIDEHNEKLRIRASKLKNSNNWLHGSFYDLFLLNNKDNLVDSFKLLNEYINEKKL